MIDNLTIEMRMRCLELASGWLQYLDLHVGEDSILSIANKFESFLFQAIRESGAPPDVDALFDQAIAAVDKMTERP